MRQDPRGNRRQTSLKNIKHFGKSQLSQKLGWRISMGKLPRNKPIHSQEIKKILAKRILSSAGPARSFANNHEILTQRASFSQWNPHRRSHFEKKFRENLQVFPETNMAKSTMFHDKFPRQRPQVSREFTNPHYKAH